MVLLSFCSFFLFFEYILYFFSFFVRTIFLFLGLADDITHAWRMQAFIYHVQVYDRK